ncbi:hypothetical protein BHM03_00024014 [Ensete ventricosum]|nr:hypothetical protein BHM03_00024014 [Ensete ventricosum]
MYKKAGVIASYKNRGLKQEAGAVVKEAISRSWLPAVNEGRNYVLQETVVGELELLERRRQVRQIHIRVYVRLQAVAIVQLVRLLHHKILAEDGRHRRRRRRREQVCAPPSDCCGAFVSMFPFVGGDHDSWILIRSLHPLLHRALLRRATIVAPAAQKTRASSPRSDRFEKQKKMYVD